MIIGIEVVVMVRLFLSFTEDGWEERKKRSVLLASNLTGREGRSRGRQRDLVTLSLFFLLACLRSFEHGKIIIKFDSDR